MSCYIQKEAGQMEDILKLTGAFLWLFAVITPVEEDTYKGF
jgi:hypothetical protein